MARDDLLVQHHVDNALAHDVGVPQHRTRDFARGQVAIILVEPVAKTFAREGLEAAGVRVIPLPEMPLG